MRRGKGDDKIMGPMFPRLHVNNTDKGGPRAPPRNKMALYEQLSIPSQRFDQGILSLNPNNASNTIPPSTSQDNGHEKQKLLPLHLPPSTHSAEKLYAHSSHSNTHLSQFESRKKTDEDDFRVPVFLNSNISLRKFYNNSERENVGSPSSLTFLGHSGKELKHTSRENLRELENPTQLPARREKSVKASMSSPSRDKKENCIKLSDLPLHSKQRDDPANKSGLLHKSGINIQPEIIDNSKVGGTNDDADISGPFKNVEVGVSSNAITGFQGGEQIVNLVNNPESQEYQTCRSLQTGNVDGGDNSSETSMVECISGMDISPDDVVEIIGQKHFWDARRAIVNQQRVFAVQVFELHKLIKVQKLLAGSPVEYITKSPLQNVPNHKSAEMPHLTMECSAENTLGKSSISSVQNATQAPSYKPSPGNTPLAVVSNDSSMSPWCFPQPSGHQWLIPMMTPSEGLVYKPYPGPGFMSADCGGCGPPGPNPAMGSFLASAYGVPASQYHYQGMSAPFAPPASHGYFPPYGVPLMNPAVSTSAVEQMNPFPGIASPVQISGAGGNLNPQSSCNTPIQNGAVPDAKRLHACKDNELRTSCASSPSERAQGVTISGPMQGSGVLPLFPNFPSMDMDASQPPDTAHPARVIRVVPHNARSASESAARIFQSIQKERKQYESR